MKYLVIFFLVSFSLTAQALIKVGEEVPDQCFQVLENTPTNEEGPNVLKNCLFDSDSSGKVTVLIHNAGWCGPCNKEMRELSKLVLKFENEPVRFWSLSAQGWKRGSPPTAEFLKEWKERHSIPTEKVDFKVAASPNNFGKTFISPTYIPNIAILDKKGILRAKGTSNQLSVDEALRLITKLAAE